MKITKICTLCLAIAAGLCASAQDPSLNGARVDNATRQISLIKPKPFYSSKANIVGVSGNYQYLKSIGLGPKIFENPVDINATIPCPADAKKHKFSEEEILTVLQKLNAEKAGNKILKFLYVGNNGQLDETRLNQRSIANTKRDQKELMEESYINIDNKLQEDIVPLLANNFIFLTHACTDGTAYMAFKADMGDDVFNDVMACWDQGAAVLDKLDVPIVFVGSGFIKNETDADDLQYVARQSIAHNIPAMAVRGKVLGRRPYTADFNINDGAEVGDRVEIYRSILDKDGQLKSKRISTARIGAMDEETAYLFSIAGSRASDKNGDMAVVVPDKRMSIFFDAVWSPHVWGFDATYSWQTFVTKYGITGQLLGDLGFAMTDKPGKSWVALTNGGVMEAEPGDIDMYTCFKSPIFFHLGAGFGVSYTVAGLVEFMPYAMLQAEGGYMINRKDLTATETDKNNKSVFGTSIRGLGGVKVNFNLCYKFQISIGGGYAYTYGLNDDKTLDTGSNWTDKNYKNYRPVKDACELIGAKRTGLFLSAGLRWRF